MNGSILGIGTDVPEFTITQADIFERLCAYFSLEGAQKTYMKNIYENSSIKKRHIVDENFLSFIDQDASMASPGMTPRNDIYKKTAHLLAEKAAKKALKMWGGNAEDITHIISVSCTGVVIPGIEFLLIEALGLKRSVFRLGINFMGCFGAFKGLHVAQSFAKENPNARILMICTELCSLHAQGNLQPDAVVSNSIFADGSAAVVVGGGIKEGETPLWEIKACHSFGLENSLDQMTWEASDHGFLMKLSTYVPISISRKIKPFTESIHARYAECDFAIHPGGKAILQTVEKKLQLTKEQTASSWNILENFGNMSSATFLFVLEEMLKKGDRRKETIGLGFGPGLSVEGILLESMS